MWSSRTASLLAATCRVRGLDIANLIIIDGDSGLVLIDPLLSNEMAKAAGILREGQVRH